MLLQFRPLDKINCWYAPVQRQPLDYKKEYDNLIPFNIAILGIAIPNIYTNLSGVGNYKIIEYPCARNPKSCWKANAICNPAVVRRVVCTPCPK
ncbi:hypothetical protein SAMN04515695_4074 [Pseudovibrio sp. Tun.PSC04-5.I4]|nr:hypothetical protein SAMN04515695_4074 [Pseudovibrio sp. Tun.PSC04-5.I4]